jgi:hypothetical protein
MEKFPKKINAKLLFQESTYFTSAIRSLSIKFLEILEILILDRILKIFNKGKCSFFCYQQIHILFGIFQAREAVF